MHNARFGVFKQIWRFMVVRKKWWLAPLIVILALFGVLLVMAQSSPLAPFIYTIF